MQSLFFGSLGRYVSINGMTGIWETERKREGEIEDKGKKEQGLTLDVFLFLLLPLLSYSLFLFGHPSLVML